MGRNVERAPRSNNRTIRIRCPERFSFDCIISNRQSLIRGPRRQPAAVAVLSRGPIFAEWLSINFCVFCTHARIDVGIVTSDAIALRDLPHDSSEGALASPSAVTLEEKSFHPAQRINGSHTEAKRDLLAYKQDSWVRFVISFLVFAETGLYFFIVVWIL